MDRRGHGHAAGGNRFPRLGERVPTTTGFFRHRAVNRPVRSCADLSGAAHSAWPPPATPSFLGRIFLMTEIGNSASTTACSVRIRLGDSRATPTRPASRQAPREPVEQHGLAVAARPHQRHVVRRSVTAKQVRHALRQHPLLLLAPGWVRLRHGRLLAYCPPCSPSWKESVT